MTRGVSRLGCAVTIALLATGPATAWQSSTIVPGRRFGPIEETTSRAALDRS